MSGCSFLWKSEMLENTLKMKKCTLVGSGGKRMTA
jgi:hypothetical protein